MSSFFNKRNNLSAQPLQPLYEVLTPLSPIMRNAVVGLLAGFGPKIIVQTNDVRAAIDDWNLKYRAELSAALHELRRRMPVNAPAIETIARDVYIKRNTLRTHDLTYWIFQGQVKDWSFETNDANAVSDMSQLIMNSYYEISDKYQTISELPSYDLSTFKWLNEIIDAGIRNPGVTVTRDFWRALCAEYIAHERWILRADDQATYKPEIIRVIISQLFAESMLPEPLLDQVNVNFDYLTEIMLNYVWDQDASTTIIPAAEVPLGYVEPSVEDLVPLVSVQHFIDNTILPNDNPLNEDMPAEDIDEAKVDNIISEESECVK